MYKLFLFRNLIFFVYLVFFHERALVSKTIKSTLNKVMAIIIVALLMECFKKM